MAEDGTFGASYRKDVKDVNEGKVPAKAQGFSSNVSTTGTKVTYTDPTFKSVKDANVSAILQLGTETLGKAATKDQAQRFSKDMQAAVQLSLEDAAAEVAKRKDGESAINTIFGRSSDDEGFRKGAAEQAANQRLLEINQRMPDLIKTMTPTQLIKEGQTQLAELKDLYKDDEDMQNSIGDLWINGFRHTVKAHAAPRYKYEKDRFNMSQVDGAMQAGVLLKTAVTEEARVENEQKLDAFTVRSEGTLPEDHSDNLADVMAKGLQTNDSAIFERWSKNPKVWDQVEPEDQRTLLKLKEGFDKRNSEESFVASQALDRAILDQDFQLAGQMANRIAQRWPLTTNLNQINHKIGVAHNKYITEERRINGEVSNLLSNNHGSRAIKSADHVKVYNRAQSAISRNALLDSPALSIIQKENITPEMEKDWRFKNPLPISTFWRDRQQKSPELQGYQSEFTALVQKGEPTPDDVERLQELSQHLQVFRKTDEALFNKSYVNPQEAMLGSAMMDLMDSGWSPANIANYMANNKLTPSVDMKDEFHQNNLLAMQESAYDNYVSKYGKDNPWLLNLAKSNPDNHIRLKNAINQGAENTYKFFKGDTRLGSAAITSDMHNTGIMIGNNFHPDLGRLQSRTKYSIPEFVKGLSYSPRMRQALKANGMPEFATLHDDPRFSIAPANDLNHIIISYNDGDYYRSMTIKPPSRDEHMIDYDKMQTNGKTLKQQSEYDARQRITERHFKDRSVFSLQ